MDSRINEEKRGRKRWLRLAAGLFVLLLAASTLLGRTLLSLSLPKVVAEESRMGQLSVTFKGTAVVKPMEERELSGPAGWRAVKVRVHEGDAVRRGDILAEYDSGEAGQQLAAEKAALQKLKLGLDKLQYDYIQAVTSGEEGAVLSAKASLESAKVDIGVQQQRILDLQQAHDANRRLTAPFDGMVTAVLAQEGMDATAGAADFRLTNTERGFQLAFRVPAALAELLHPEDVMEGLLADAEDKRIVQGRIVGLDETDGGEAAGGGQEEDADAQLTMVRLSLMDEGLKGGERVEVNWTKAKGGETLLLASRAVHRDSAGSYVFTLEARSGPLGNAFYAVRRAVVAGASDAGLTAVSEGLFEHEQVIVDSSEPIAGGERVRL